MGKRHLDKNALDGYIHLFAGRGYSWEEFKEVLTEDFENLRVLNADEKGARKRFDKIKAEFGR